jgi:hypothetical protein
MFGKHKKKLVVAGGMFVLHAVVMAAIMFFAADAMAQSNGPIRPDMYGIAVPGNRCTFASFIPGAGVTDAATTMTPGGITPFEFNQVAEAVDTVGEWTPNPPLTAPVSFTYTGGPDKTFLFHFGMTNSVSVSSPLAAVDVRVNTVLVPGTINYAYRLLNQNTTTSYGPYRLSLSTGDTVTVVVGTVFAASSVLTTNNFRATFEEILCSPSPSPL